MGYFLGKESLAVPSPQTLNPGVPAAPTPAAGGGTAAPTTKATPGESAAEVIARCKTRCGGIVEPCFSTCLREAGLPKDEPTDCVPGKQCMSDSECPGGKCDGVARDPVTNKITTGKCNCAGGGGGGEPPGGCPEGKGNTYEGCPCGHGYATLTGSCVTGYRFIPRDPNNWDASDIPVKPGAKGTCECEKAIADWKANKQSSLGEYEYPRGLQEIMTLLMNRGKGFNGLDPAAIEAMFGKGFENIRTAESGSRDQLNRRLASQGMLGTGTAVEAGKDLGWNTEKSVIDLARDIMIKNEEMKRSDTELLSSILGRGMGFEQMLEAINAGRRGEGQNALAMILSLLQLFKG